MKIPQSIRIDPGRLIFRAEDLALENLDPVTVYTTKRVVGVNRFRIKRDGRVQVTNITETVNLARRYPAEFNRAINLHLKRVCKLERAPRWRYIYHS